MRPNIDDYALRTIMDQREWEPWRRKVLTHFRILPGHIEALLGVSSAMNTISDRDVGTKRQYPEQFVKGLLEGHINYPLRDIATLMKQVAFRTPHVAFKGLTPESQWFHQKYIERRTNKHSSAGLQAELALWSYLVAGIGILGVEFHEDAPTIVYKNPLDVTYDMHVETIDRVRWISVKSRETWEYWRHMFGAGFEKKIPATSQLVELEFWYSRDLLKQKGRHYVFGSAGQIIEGTNNPFTRIVDGQEEAFLPYKLQPLYFLPWNTFPLGILEMMLPNALAAWKAADMIDAVMEQGGGIRAINPDKLDPDSVDKIKAGERTSTIFTNGADPSSAIYMHQGFSVAPDVYSYLQRNEEASVSMAGADPYASGATAPNARFATEAQAINARSSLTRDKVAADYVQMWSEVVEMFLHTGKKFDSKPIVLTREDGTQIEFSENSVAGPPALHLRPDADIVIRADTTGYTGQAEEIAQASRDLRELAPYFGTYPEAMKEMLERYLIAIGITDVAALLAEPVLSTQAGDEAGTQATGQK